MTGWADKLTCPTEPNRLEALIGSLTFLNKEAAEMANEIQYNGRPRDLAEECWILEMEDIYENSFCRPPTLSGSGNDPSKRRGKFYRFLEHGLPPSFFRHGKLSLRHVKRTLALRTRNVPEVLTLGDQDCAVASLPKRLTVGHGVEPPPPTTDSLPAPDHEPVQVSSPALP